MYGGKANSILQKSVIVREIAVADEPNLNFRPKMEDAYFIGENFNNDMKYGVYGVLDGHGGKEVAEYVAKNFVTLFSKFHKNLLNQPEKLVKDTYSKLEAMLQFIGAGDVGATCCTAYFAPEPNGKTLYVANLGDTRAVLARKGRACRLTVDHKATEPSEVERVKSKGFIIANNRLAGQLAITRAFGDFNLKTQGLSAEPTVSRTELNPNDQLLIIATDGLWDVIDDQQAVDICLKYVNPLEMAKALIDAAMKSGTMDNTSVMILKLS